MKKICILIGRKIRDNLTRELTLIKELNYFDIECLFLIPGKNLSHSYYTKEDLVEFKNSNYIYIETLDDFKKISEDFQFFLVASWRDYQPLVKLLKKNKKKIIVYSEAGGIDYWDLGGDQFFFKSLANILLYTNARRNHLVNLYRKFICRKAKITGSLRYQYFSKHIPQKKNLQIVFFPKSISNVETKVRHWFKLKSNYWYDEYLKNMKNNYSIICKLIENAGFKVSVRLHYAINDKLMAYDYGKNDFDFWKIKQSIMNEIIINNIKSENLDNIINELIKKYN
jgi:virulence-associated protein VapD